MLWRTVPHKVSRAGFTLPPKRKQEMIRMSALWHDSHITFLHIHTTQWKCEIQQGQCQWAHALILYPWESFSYTLSQRLVHMGTGDLLRTCVCVCVCWTWLLPRTCLPRWATRNFPAVCDSCVTGEKSRKNRKRGTNQRKEEWKTRRLWSWQRLKLRGNLRALCAACKCVCVCVFSAWTRCISGGCKLCGFLTRVVVASQSNETRWSWMCAQWWKKYSDPLLK